MTEQHENFNSIEHDRPVQLSAKELQTKRFQPRALDKAYGKTPVRVQVSKPPKNSVKLKPTSIQVHLKWAIILTILCFFLLGPCWALYKTLQLKKMIQRQEADAATRLSHTITTVLIVSTLLGAVAWTAILFCSVGLLLTGKLLQANAV